MLKREKRVSDHLKKSGYHFDRQVWFDECRNERVLPFDFAVYDKDKLICLIEYQGMQHYEPVELFGGREQLRVQKLHDRIKREFCKKNNIPLIEIPYWEIDNIEKTLNKKLNNLFKTVN